MGNAELPPFVVDRHLTQLNQAKGRKGTFATVGSVRQAFIDQSMADLAVKKIAMPFNGQVLRGEVAVLTAEECSIEDLSRNYPAGFIQRAGLFALLPAVER